MRPTRDNFLKALAGLFLFIPLSLAAQWEEFPLLPGESLWASSVLTETQGGGVISYPPENLFDADHSTPWVEGAAGDGEGENVVILTGKAATGIGIVNGFAKSETLFAKNNRIKELGLSLVIGFTAPGMVSETDVQLYMVQEFQLDRTLQLEDQMTLQLFSVDLSPEEQLGLSRSVFKDFTADYPFFFNMMLEETGLSRDEIYEDSSFFLFMEIYGFLALKVTILDVFRGSLYRDTCLTEIILDLEDF